MPIHEKKRTPKPNHYYRKSRGWRFGQGNASVRSLAPPPIRICISQGKMIRGIPIFFVGERFYLQYLPTKKKTTKANHLSSKYAGSKIQKNIPSVRTDVGPPSAFLYAKENW
jgi:hypothetical protein